MSESYPIIPGAEPFFFKGNHVGILVCHGYVGTPQSVYFLGKHLADKGYTVYGPRLKGHGTYYKEMEECTYQDWIHNLEEGYQFLKLQCTDVFIIGQSMGGTLAINLASKHPNINGIALINPALTSIPSMEEYKMKQEPRFINEGAPDIKANNVHEIAYDKVPVRSIQQLLSLMDHTREQLVKVTSPILIFKSLVDHVVPGENADYILTHILSDQKELRTLYNSYHVASMDNDKEFIAEHCTKFMENNLLNAGKEEVI